MPDDVQAIRAEECKIQIVKWRPVAKTWPGKLDFVKLCTPILVSIVPRHLCTFALSFAAIQHEIVLCL